MKNPSSSATAKASPARVLALLAALVLGAAQSLPAQTSLQAGLIVTNLSSGGQDGVSFYLSWTAPTNGMYLVQSSTNLADAAGWTTEDLVPAAPGPLEWTSPQAVQEQKFYRLVEPQPQIFSAQPSVLPAGSTQTVLLAGQLFPANAQVLVNGTVDGDVTVVDSSDILVTINASAPGAYVIELTASGVLLSSVTVHVYNPATPPAYALQEPPEDPPGSPVTPPNAQFLDGDPDRPLVLGRLYGSAGPTTFEPDPTMTFSIWKPIDSTSPKFFLHRMIDKSSPQIIQEAQDTDGQLSSAWLKHPQIFSSAALKHPGGFSGGTSSAALNWGGGGDNPMEYATLLMPALMKAKEKANQVKCQLEPPPAMGGAWTENIAFNLQPPAAPGGAWTDCAAFHLQPPASPGGAWTEGIAMAPGTHLGLVASGEVQARATDLFIPGTGGGRMAFVWTRTYRSRTGPSTALGPRWDYSYDIYCQTNSHGVTVFDGAGRQDIYQPQSDGTFACAGCFRQGTTNLNAFQLTFADGGYWAFLPFDGSATAGKIARIVDRNGNTITFQYNTLGQMAMIVDTLGRTNTLSYSTGGQIQTLTDFAGRTVTYQYYTGGTGVGAAGGSAGDLESVTSPAVTGTPNGNDFPAGKTTTYTYSSGYANAAENHLLISVTDPLGQKAHVFTYDHNAGDFSYLRCTNEQWGNPGQALTYDWEPQTPQAGQYAVLKCVVNDAVGNVTEYYYDSLNRPVRRLEYTGRATPGVTTTSTANRPTNPLRTSDPAYFETDWEWNNDSLCTLETEPGGDSIQYVYQGDLNPSTPARFRANLFVRRRKPHGDANDTALWPDGLATYYQYDSRFGSELVSSFNIMKKTEAEHTGQLIGNHKDCMMASAYVSPNTGKAMVALGGTSLGDGTGRMNRVRMACFPVGVTDPRHNQTVCTYDASGNLLHLQHNGNTPGAGEDAVAPEDFTYNSAGQMTSHTLPDNGSGHRRVDEAVYYTSGPQQGYLQSFTVDTSGEESPKETITFAYDAYGNVTNRVDPLGNAYIYTVNALNQVVQEQSPPVSATVSTSYTNQFAYDADDNLISATTPGINGDGIPDNTVTGLTTWTYDTLNFVTSESDRIDSTHNAVTAYQYDANRNATNVILPEASNGDDPSNTVSLQYDERDLPFKRVRAPGSPQPSTDQFDVTLDGELSRVTHGLEAGPEVVNFFYDGFERPLAEQDAMGNVVTNYLDPNGNVVLQSFLGPTNQVSGAANVLLAQTSLTYDNLDRPTRRDDAFFDLTTGSPIGSGQSVTTVTYSDTDDVTSWTDARGNTTLLAYDTVNRVASVTDAAGDTVQYAYDANDNLVSRTETDQSGLGGTNQVFSLISQYDNLNRLTAEIDNVGNTNSAAYNSRGDLTLRTDARGTDTFFQYDGLNRCTAAIGDLNGDGIPDLGDIETKTGYDGDSRLISFTDDNGNTTSHTYDSLNRVIQTQWADGSLSTNGYDPHDNLVMTADQNGTVVSNSYDLLNRRTNTTVLAYGGATASTTSFETYSYDGLSRLTQWVNDAATCGAAYDSLGDCVSESLNGQTTASTFDAMGNRLTLTYPGGGVLTYSYDLLSRQTNVSGGGVTLETLSYAGPNRLAARQYANGTSSLFSYDGAVGSSNAPGDSGWGQVSGVIQLPATSGSGTPAISDWAFQYDPTGNKTGRTQSAIFGTAGSQAGPQQQTFAYDAVDRLTNARVFSGTTLLRLTTYALDGVGNRTNVGGYDETCGGAYTLNATTPGPLNFQVNEYTTTGCDSRQYNANQDLTNKTSASGAVSLAYDFRDRLVSIANSATGTAASYSYDALGRRIGKTVSSFGLAPQTTSYFYDGRDVVQEQNGLGVTQATYALDDTGIVSMTRSSQTYYCHCDDLGNVLDLTDAGGAVAERYDYDDYGQPQFLNAEGGEESGPTGLATQSSVGNPYLFQSSQWDPESGFYMIEVTDMLGKKHSYLHREMVVHRDLAARNTLLAAAPGYLDPKSGRNITACVQYRETAFCGEKSELAPSGNAFEFQNNNPWSASSISEKVTLHHEGMYSGDMPSGW